MQNAITTQIVLFICSKNANDDSEAYQYCQFQGDSFDKFGTNRLFQPGSIGAGHFKRFDACDYGRECKRNHGANYPVDSSRDSF